MTKKQVPDEGHEGGGHGNGGPENGNGHENGQGGGQRRNFMPLIIVAILAALAIAAYFCLSSLGGGNSAPEEPQPTATSQSQAEEENTGGDPTATPQPEEEETEEVDSDNGGGGDNAPDEGDGDGADDGGDAPVVYQVPSQLPAGMIVTIPKNSEGTYDFDPAKYAGWLMVCEGTQKATGNLHLIKVAPTAVEQWDRLSCWGYPSGQSDAVMTQLAYQFAGDKVRNWESAGVKPLPMRLFFAGGETLDLEAGVIPDDYSLDLAGVDLDAPMQLFIHGIYVNGHYVASIGAVDEWTYVVLKVHDALGEGTSTMIFFGTQENVSYDEVLMAWRLPGGWSEAEVQTFAENNQP